MTPRTSTRWLLAGPLVVALIGLASTSAAAAPTPVDAKAKPAATDLVVKVDLAGGHTIGEVTTRYDLAVDGTLLASRGIYLVRPNRPNDLVSASTVDKLIKTLGHDKAVLYAEANLATQLDDSRMHGWREGPTGEVAYDAADFLAQPAATGLAEAHRSSTGRGVTVAVLDTGIAADHPAFAGRVVAGWDYVDDDPDPTDPAVLTIPADPAISADPADPTGPDVTAVPESSEPVVAPGSAAGHGTFVAGLVGLVAPEATILSERVLDQDGTGNVYVIAQAILDAVAAGAGVVNLSFGTDGDVASKLLDETLELARDRGVMVVVSAGNLASSHPSYPADSTRVLCVTALAASVVQVASYANYGPWVEVAAPGTDVIGPLLGGGYASWSGTSMAAPMVSGQVALVRSRAPKLGLAGQTAAVLRSADRLPAKKMVRYGAVNVSASLLQALR